MVIIEAILLVALYPLWLVFYCPLMLSYLAARKSHRKHLCLRIFFVPLIFLLGMFFNISFIPMALLGTVLGLVALPFVLIILLIVACKRCCCPRGLRQ